MAAIAAMIVVVVVESVARAGWRGHAMHVVIGLSIDE
jgi:hypothetical protein